MKAKPGVLDQLQGLLTTELTATHQYRQHAEMLRNWGYERLHQQLRAYSSEEAADAEHLVQHMLYLEGSPDLQQLHPISVGTAPEEQLRIDLQLEQRAVQGLTEAITHCAQVGDYTTRGLLEAMVQSEEAQIDWLETQLHAIQQVGLQNYLAQQILDS
jgi:bacterioferritin